MPAQLVKRTLPNAIGWGLSHRTNETYIPENPQSEVSTDELQPNGRLRGAIKLKVYFPPGFYPDGRTIKPVEGTGVLIDENVVVTSGHMLYDSGSRCHAQRVVLSAGINGPLGSNEDRTGSYAVVHGNWFAHEENTNDVGFIYISTKFTMTQPLPYDTTPISCGGLFGDIYGYPFGQSCEGLSLCKSRSRLWFTGTTVPTMLEHLGSTEHGNSGGPVIDDNGNVIAIHACWGLNNYGVLYNMAVPINHFGNDFEMFICLVKSLTSHANWTRHSEMCGRNVEVEIPDPKQRQRVTYFSW